VSKRVVIVGSGVAGLCAAYYCARRGFAVTVVERRSASRDNCSFGNAGLVVPSHFIPLAAPGMVALALKWMGNPASPFYLKPRVDLDLFNWGCKFWGAATAGHVRRCAPLLRDLNLASRTCFEELAELPETDFGFTKQGLLMLCQTEHALQEEARTAARARELGLPAEVLDARQTAALEPTMRMNIAGSVLFPLDCHLTPNRFLAALQHQLVKLKVEFAWNSEVVAWNVGADHCLRSLSTADGREIAADEFVVCGGSWSAQLVRQLGLRLPLQAGKGYSLTLPQPRQLPQRPALLTEARVAVTPMGSGLRVGGTMELAGLNEDINPVRVQGIIGSFCRYYPEFRAEDFAGVQPWRGLRPCSPDGMPYVGRTARFANLSLATAHGMMGLSLGPITGKLIADLLSGEKPAWDLRLLSPDRFA
jgi:D-amino-acid dehydrogenase